MSGPFLGQILPIRDGIPLNKEKPTFPVCIILGNFEDRVILPSFPFQQIPM
uniref:Uncharacterized protein n=1 Tax=Helianthus annuus TaxID=4232 RepID=A0A1Y3BW68_HELAN